MNIFVNFLAFIVAFVAVITLFIFIILLILYVFKIKAFPKKTLKFIGVCVGIFAILFIYDQFFFTFNRIDREYLQPADGPKDSPSGAYTAQAYYEPYGGVLGDVNVFVEVLDNKSGDKKVIYYANAKSFFRLAWTFNEDLEIYNEENQKTRVNDKVVLKVTTEIYHDRGLACQSILLRNSYETCYKD